MRTPFLRSVVGLGCCCAFGVSLEMSAAVIEVDYLLDHGDLTVNPSGIDVGGTYLNQWRYSAGVAWQATNADAGTANDTFNGGSVSLQNHLVVTEDADYDPTTTMLTGVSTGFSNEHIVIAASASLDVKMALRGYYTLSIETDSMTYTGTSDSALLLDGTRKGSSANNALVENDVVAAWNTISWDVDPFAGGAGILYSDIDTIDINFFADQEGTNADASSSTWFTVKSIEIGYEATTFSAAVPEPSTTSLFGLGGLAILARRRR